jgi:phosphopantothenoylcysteine decarboxylase / phosphopantothenate---cysteine ligase
MPMAAGRPQAPGKRFRRTLLGVSGSSAAVATGRLVRILLEEFTTEVTVIVTRQAEERVPPLNFAVLGDDDWKDSPLHVTVTDGIDLFLVAPATAHTLGKAAAGLADNLLSTAILAARRPVVFFPAMNNRMWRQPAVQRNVRTLREDGHRVIDPIKTWAMSTGRHGDGVGYDQKYFSYVMRELQNERTES